MFLLILAILIATIIFFKGLKIFNYFDHVAGIMEMIPGPTPYPFVGNLFQFGLKPDEYPKKILQYCRKYDFQGFRSLVLFQYHIMLSDPAEIKNMLSSSALLYKEHLYLFLKPWLGDGLLTSSGARWLKHQKLYIPAFEKKAIEGYLKVVHKSSDKMIRKLQQLAEDEWYFDIQEYVLKCTLDIVCENATGYSSNSLDDKPSDLHKAIKDLCNVIQERTFSIVKRFDTLFYLTPYYWKQRKALQVLKREMNWIIERRRQKLHEHKREEAAVSSADGSGSGSGVDEYQENSIKKPFLDVLLNAKLDGGPLKNRDIFEELSTFIFTGHEPTASAISFTLYTLSRHPEIQQAVYEEQQTIFGKYLKETNVRRLLCNEHDVGDAAVDWSNLEQMHYLEQVIRETLRLYPSVPLIARTNRKPIDINGTKIARRTTVIMCLIAMGYNEKYFDEPCEFRPERFAAKSSSDSKKSDEAEGDASANDGIEAYKSVPFSAGPRQCIAEKYAMLELKAIISKIIRNFELLPPREELRSGINDHSKKDCVPQSEFDPILNIRITLKSENGILLRLRKRS